MVKLYISKNTQMNIGSMSDYDCAIHDFKKDYENYSQFATAVSRIYAGAIKNDAELRTDPPARIANKIKGSLKRKKDKYDVETINKILDKYIESKTIDPCNTDLYSEAVKSSHDNSATHFENFLYSTEAYAIGCKNAVILLERQKDQVPVSLGRVLFKFTGAVVGTIFDGLATMAGMTVKQVLDNAYKYGDDEMIEKADRVYDTLEKFNR